MKKNLIKFQLSKNKSIYSISRFMLSGIFLISFFYVTPIFINFAEKNKKKLNQLKIEEIKKIEPKLNSDVFKVFDLKYSINSKTSFGGTSFVNIKKMIRSYKKDL